MEKILVTGGAGYIGSHTCKLLAKSGFEPIVYDNLITGHKEFVKWGPFVEADILDTNKLIETFSHYKPTAVIHFAAYSNVGDSVLNPLKYYRNNVGGTLSLLEAMFHSKIDILVFSSTCAIYGLPDKKLLDENCPQKPINPYGESKLMIETILKNLSADNKLKFMALRYFNAAGADSEGEIGEWHDPETHLIPLAINSANKKEKLKVFGTNFNTPDGTAIRDYIHVEDLAKGHLMALNYLQSGKASDLINIGTGKGSSVYEIIKKIKESGVDVNYVNTKRRKGDPAYLVANISKANKVLDWKPKYNNIEEILKTAINWHLRDNS